MFLRISIPSPEVNIINLLFSLDLHVANFSLIVTHNILTPNLFCLYLCICSADLLYTHGIIYKKNIIEMNGKNKIFVV